MTVSIAHTVSCTHPPALLPLRALAAVSGVANISFSSNPLTASGATGPSSFGNPNGIKFQLETATTDAFGSTTTSTVSGLAAIVRFFAEANPTLGLYGGGNAADSAQMDGWIEAASGLLVAAYGDAAKEVEGQMKRAVEEFGASVEAALSSAPAGSKSACLVDEGVTAADVVVSIVLAAAATRVKADPLGPKVDALIHLVLTNPTIQAAIGEGGGEGMSAKEMQVVEGAVPQLAAEMDQLSMAGTGAAGGAKGAAIPSDAELAANPLVLQLAELGLEAKTYGHVPCLTADELVTSVPLPSSTHTHTKNLFFKDKKHGLFLITATPSAVIDTKSLGKDLLKLEGKVNMRLAAEDVLMEKLGCAKGCVGPLAIANNSERDVTLVLDENLLKREAIHSHPLRNDASTVLTSQQLREYLEKVGVEPIVVDFPQKGDGEGKAEQWAGKPPASRPKTEGEGGGKKAKPKIPKKDKKDKK